MSSGGQEAADPVKVKLSVGEIRSALKEALRGKYTEDHINRALQELGLPQEGTFDFRKVLEKAPSLLTEQTESSQDDLLDANWGEFFSKLGLPMSEDEAKKVMSAAKVSFTAKTRNVKTEAESLDGTAESDELERDVCSAIDLTAAKEEEEKELVKMIEELEVENETPTPSAEENEVDYFADEVLTQRPQE